MEQKLLTVKNLSYSIDSKRSLFSNLSFEIKNKEFWVLSGPNGSGKSTLLSILLGNKKPTTGKVEKITKKIFYVPQLQNLANHIPFTLSDVVELLSGEKPKAEMFLSESQLSLNWNTASGGEKQRALLLSALLTNPELIFLDEPFNHLDVESKSFLVEKLLDVSLKATLFLVSHLEIPELKSKPNFRSIKL